MNERNEVEFDRRGMGKKTFSIRHPASQIARAHRLLRDFPRNEKGQTSPYRPCSTFMMVGVTCPREAALISACDSRPEVIPRVSRAQ